MYDDLIVALRGPYDSRTDIQIMRRAADAIEDLCAKVDILQMYMDNISKLPDCNTCLKKTWCEFRPIYGEYCRINCPAWLGVPESKQEDEQNDS